MNMNSYDARSECHVSEQHKEAGENGTKKKKKKKKKKNTIMVNRTMKEKRMIPDKKRSTHSYVNLW